ncbi:MAG: nucleotidyltransferase [Thermobacillus sp.]|nr:MAG: nucleotidyltransferase [Thermobacillus sp.]
MGRSAMSADIRWKQRYENFDKALDKLVQALTAEHLSELERAGAIQYYQFTFELAWKTLKDYMEERGIDANFPRDVIKEAFRYGLIEDGELWLDMLQKRNVMAHTYDESMAELAFGLIRDRFTAALKQVHGRLGMDR